MARKLRVHAADLRGVNRLVIDGIAGVVDLVEAMHYNIASVPGLIAKPKRGRTTGITGLVYRGVHGVIGLVGHGLDRLLAQLEQARLDVRRVATVGVLRHQPPRPAQPTGSLRADQAVAGCTGLSFTIRHNNEAAARIRREV
jgi:hypothetical protein